MSDKGSTTTNDRFDAAGTSHVSTAPTRAVRPEALIKRKDAHALAAGYSRTFRVVEYLSIAAFVVMSAGLVYRLSAYTETAWLIYATAFIGGMIGADLVSGLVHWAGDTWGTPEWPVLGSTLIRPFREHHVDQLALTRHDFVELNGANCLISIPVLGIALAIPLSAESPWALLIVAGMTSLTLWVFFTNQIHQWAHLREDERPHWVTLLQRTGLILSYEHHQIHHKAPYLEYFCITTGWCNEPLKRMSFYRIAERVIHAVTGAIPRQDDIGEVAARVIHRS